MAGEVDHDEIIRPWLAARTAMPAGLVMVIVTSSSFVERSRGSAAHAVNVRTDVVTRHRPMMGSVRRSRPAATAGRVRVRG
jgi:hypothetical protein